MRVSGFLVPVGLAVMALASPPTANAITLDFESGTLLADLATRHECDDDNDDWCGDAGAAMTFSNVGGTTVDLDVTADGPGSSSNWFVWHDLRPDEAGLGASNDEDDRNTDNIFGGEEVTLDFNETVILDSWVALNHGNGLLGATYSLWVDNVLRIDKTGVTEAAVNALGFSGNTFRFLNTSNIDGITGNSNGRIYISTAEFRVPVPEPGTLLMLGLGLFGLSLSRRSRAAA